MVGEGPHAVDGVVEDFDVPPPRTSRLRIEHTYECRDPENVSKAAVGAVAAERVEKTQGRENSCPKTVHDPGHPLPEAAVAAEVVAVGPVVGTRVVEYSHRREGLPARP